MINLPNMKTSKVPKNNDRIIYGIDEIFTVKSFANQLSVSNVLIVFGAVIKLNKNAFNKSKKNIDAIG